MTSPSFWSRWSPITGWGTPTWWEHPSIRVFRPITEKRRLWVGPQGQAEAPASCGLFFTYSAHSSLVLFCARVSVRL